MRSSTRTFTSLSSAMRMRICGDSSARCAGTSTSPVGSVGSSGTSSVNVEPRKGSLSTVSRPPINPASCREIDRPRPVPPRVRVGDESICVNGTKILSRSSASMPTPVSRTAN